MKKRILAGLTAAVMLCGMLSVPAFAEKTGFELGDVNMNGVIDLGDCLDVFEEYNYQVAELGHFLTPEQLESAKVCGGDTVTLDDVILLLAYYNFKVVGQFPEEVIGKNIAEYRDKLSEEDKEWLFHKQ